MTVEVQGAIPSLFVQNMQNAVALQSTVAQSADCVDKILDQGETFIFARRVVPTGKKLVILAGGVTRENGASLAGIAVTAYNASTGAAIATVTNSGYTALNTEVAAGTNVEFKLVNGSTTDGVALSGNMVFAIWDA